MKGVFIIVAGTSARGSLSAPLIILWEAIRWVSEHGFKFYEEMDAGDDPRLRHFKAKFNPELAPWFSAVKYSSPVFKVLERTTRFVYNKFGLGGLI